MKTKTFKFILVTILIFSLSGCALIQTLINLIPTILGLLVEYSPPIQTEDEQILCVKALRYYQSNGDETKIIQSEYFLVMLDNNGTEITNLPLNIGQDYFEINGFSLTKINSQVFGLSLADAKLCKDWEVKVIDLQVASRLHLNPSSY